MLHLYVLAFLPIRHSCLLSLPLQEELEGLAPIYGVEPAFLAPSGLFGMPDTEKASGIEVEDVEEEEEEEGRKKEKGAYLPLVPPPELFEPPPMHPMEIFVSPHH